MVDFPGHLIPQESHPDANHALNAAKKQIAEFLWMSEYFTSNLMDVYISYMQGIVWWLFR
ncbi:hypothetical protein MPU07_000491 [Staphylococcus pseudintermedius]|uniref:hypothetical protein n=1 Tax=Staphylococcus pseudintermedius TaxID=283734 RepID=UPI00103663DB|nr:hypothetical protein [Staphylococcus pseudintermedius]EGQ0300601.1 hypothetical protein [Staphylococcus pseudintermedius]EGQ1590981.1 hypothetical protein [Staphylococcus pseudintermedius]EGQ1593163.1 hypothetical protein [Staphylococcus pseudintermedius]EGQ2670766.1 hypothetical protein [Staphylococcus pseudintermedius]EGQ2737297.1 hypothetical protein [Staphylococcus pseudintermedius]